MPPVLPVQPEHRQPLLDPQDLLVRLGQQEKRERQVQQEAQELRVLLAVQVLQEIQDLPEQQAQQAQQDPLVLLAQRVLLEQPVPQDLKA